MNDTPTGMVTISGPAEEDETLTAAHTLADDDGLGLVSYQWLRNGTAIAGATGSTYVLSDADVGQLVAVQASYTDGQGTAESMVSSSAGPVANVNDAPVVAPVAPMEVDEDLAVGSLVTVLTASDADTGDLISWAITDGNDAGHFAIAPDGSLTLVTPLRFMDAAAHHLTVTATDNGTPELSGSTVVHIVVNRVVVPAPVAATEVSETSVEEVIAEEAPETAATASSGAGSPVEGAPPASTERGETAASQQQQTEAPVAPPTPVIPEDPTPIFVMPEISTHLADVVEARYSSGSAEFSRRVADTDTVATVVPRYEVAFRSAELNDSIAEMKNELKAATDTQFFTAATAVTTTSSLTVGYVLWAIRGGWLASSILAQMPAWRLMDPLVVLSSLNGEGGVGDDQSLQDMLKDGVRDGGSETVEH